MRSNQEQHRIGISGGRNKPRAFGRGGIAARIGKFVLCGVLALGLVPLPAAAGEEGSLAPGSYGTATVAENTVADAFESPEWDAYRASGALGTASSFHIVAFESADLRSDVYGNVLARQMESSHTFGMTHIPSLSYIQRYRGGSHNLDKSAAGTVVFGSDMKLGLSGNPVSYKSLGNGADVSIDCPRNIVRDADSPAAPFISLDRVRAEISEISERLSEHPDHGASFDFSDQNRKKISYDLDDGCAYLTIGAGDLLRNGNKVEMTGLPKDGSGTLVINVDCAGTDVSLPDPISLEVGGRIAGFGETDTEPTGYVLWNFVNAEGRTIELHSVVGSAIALGGTLELGGRGYGNSCGTFIADYVNVSAESHYRHFDGDFGENGNPSGKLSIGGKKTVDGEAPESTFSFDLSCWNSSRGKWETVERTNSDPASGDIRFSDIMLSESDTGATAWYRVSEIDADGYTCSPAAYYIESTSRLAGRGETIESAEKIWTCEGAGSDLATVAPGSDMLKAAEDGLSVDGLVFDNKTASDEKKQIVYVDKEWVCGDEGKIPDQLLVGVMDADGNMLESMLLSDENDWRDCISVPEDASIADVAEIGDDGQPVKAGEVVIDGISWTMSVGATLSLDGVWHFFISNEETGEFNTIPNDDTVSAHLVKIWTGDDEANRPDSISMTLYASYDEDTGDDDYIVEQFTVSADDGWEWEKSGLSKMDGQGRELFYSVDEESVDGYIAGLSGYYDEETGVWEFEVENILDDGEDRGDGEEPDEMSFALGGYSMASAYAEISAEKVCYVDPKIVKRLAGRALEDGEFAFELVDDVTGQVVSSAVNDKLGMVDFDAAANKAPEGMEPCCLVFKAPGTYTYTVRENSAVGRDGSVDYSGEKVRFVAEVVENDDGALVCRDQYYLYYKNADDPVGTRMEASEHPTIENTTHPITLSVRKVSADDTSIGLDGAVYRLWDAAANLPIAVSEPSDDNGWLSFTSESISYGTEYYMTEETAPDRFALSPDPTDTFTLERDGNQHYVKMAKSGERGTASDLSEPVRYDVGGGVSDEPLHFSIVKIAGDTGNPLPGAKMGLFQEGIFAGEETEDGAWGLEADGKVERDMWTSGDNPEIIVGTSAGDTYTLTEITAPKGYKTVDDIRFTIHENGDLEILGDGGASYTAGGCLYVVDLPEDEEKIDQKVLHKEVTLDDGEDISGKTGEVPGEAIASEETPLADMPQLPQTSDDMPVALLTVCAVGSALVALGAQAMYRRKLWEDE